MIQGGTETTVAPQFSPTIGIKEYNYTFKTGIEGLFMFQSQHNWERFAGMNFMYMFLGGCITLFKIVTYIILYFRTPILGALVAFSPIVVFINAIIKISGSKKDLLKGWFKIFMYCVLLRAAVALVYYLLVNSNPYLISEYPYYIIFVIVVMATMFIYSIKALERSFGYSGIFASFKKRREKKKKKK